MVGLTRAIYWKRKYRGKQEQAHWYLLTNLPDCEAAVKTSGKRFGIEAMFKDCKTGGYNLEGSQASSDRLVRLVLLIALAMSAAWLQGQHTQLSGNLPISHLPPFQLAHWVFSTKPSELHNFDGDAVSIIVVN